MLQRQYRWDNVHLHTVETEQFKTNYLSVQLMVPLSRETATQNALLPMILKRGCAAYPDADALNGKLMELYGAQLDCGISKIGECQILELSLEYLDDRYALEGEKLTPEACALLGRLICAPKLADGGFDPAFTETEKENLRDALESELGDKRTYAMNRCLGVMCGEEPYGVNRLGKTEDLASITARSLAERYETVLAEAAVELFFVGRGGEACAAALREAFVSLPKRENKLPMTVRREAGAVRRVTEEVEATQGKLVLGFRVAPREPEENGYGLSVCNALYGGTVISKLFANVREKLSLCYYCSSALERQKGLMMVSSGIENGNCAVAEEAILNELEDIRRGNFSKEELDAAVKDLVNVYRGKKDSARRIQGFLTGQLFKKSEDRPEDVIAKLQAVTREDVLRASRRISLDTVYFLKGVTA